MKIYEHMYYIIKNGQGTGRSVGFLCFDEENNDKERKLASLRAELPVSEGYTLVEESIKVITEFDSYYLKKNFKRL